MRYIVPHVSRYLVVVSRMSRYMCEAYHRGETVSTYLYYQTARMINAGHYDMCVDVMVHRYGMEKCMCKWSSKYSIVGWACCVC